MKIEIKDIFKDPEPIKYTKGWGKEGYPRLNFTEVMKEFNEKKDK